MKRITTWIMATACLVMFGGIFRAAADDPTMTVTTTPSPADNLSSAANTTVTFTITSNSNWKVESDQTWAKVTAPGTGSNNGSATVTLDANSTTAARTANIKIQTTTGTNDKTETVQIKQQAAASTPAPTLTVATTPSPADNLSNAANTTVTFTITSNAAWKVESDQTWATVTAPGTGSNNGTATVTLDENSTTAARTANIKIQTTTGTNDKTETVQIKQKAAASTPAPTLTVTPSPVPEQEATSGSVNLTVNANVAWKVEAPAGSWATPATTTGTGTGSESVTVNFGANTGIAREVDLTFTTTSGTPVQTATVKIKQKASSTPAAPNFALSVASLEVTAEKVEKKIKVEADANLDWSAVSSDLSWLKISDTRGKGTKEVTISIAENNGGTRERTGTITFQVTGIDSLKRVLTVKQTGTKFEVEITPTGNIPTAGGTVTVKVTSTSKIEMKLQNNNWMKLENTQESAGEVLYTFKVATKNSSATPRKVNVELKTKVGGLGRTITFTQNGTFSLVYDANAFSAVSQRGAEFTITVKSEDPWQPTIRIPGTASLRAGQITGTESISWIDAVYERLSDTESRRFDGKIKITVKPNLENYSREAIIDFKTSTGATVDSIHLKQFNIDGKMTAQVAKTLVTGIKLDKQVLTVENLKTVQLTATVTPADATNKTLKWESGDPAIATVSATGQVTILKKGNVIITATATDGSGKSASCAITVKSAVSNLTPGETRIYASDGCVRLALPTAQEVRIYTVSGSLVRAFTAPAGHTSISLLTGAYIVRVGTQTEKVMVE